MENKLSDYLFKDPAELAVCPEGLVLCIRDRWWPINGQGRIGFYIPLGHPSCLPEHFRRGFIGMALCYSSEEEARIVTSDRALALWAVDVVFLPFVFRPVDAVDFCD